MANKRVLGAVSRGADRSKQFAVEFSDKESMRVSREEGVGISNAGLP
jgi:hypothetical protein